MDSSCSYFLQVAMFSVKMQQLQSSISNAVRKEYFMSMIEHQSKNPWLAFLFKQQFRKLLIWNPYLLSV